MPLLQASDCTFDAKGYGHFEAVVLGAEARKYQTGSFGLNFWLEITEGPAKGKHIYSTLWLTPSAIDATLERLSNCFGFAGGIKALRPAVDGRKFDGETAKLSVSIEEYNGREQLRVNIWPRRDSKPLTDREWGELYQTLGVKPPVHQIAVTAATSGGGFVGEEDDDLPF